MSIRSIIRTVRNVGIIVAFVVPAITGAKYFVSHKQPSHHATPSVTPTAIETKHLEVFFPVDRVQRPSQVLYRKSYVVSYNKDTKCPNWALWELTCEHADGNVKRPDYAFHEDMAVPAPRAELADYRGTGFDRGHICPAGDNKWDEDAMYETFLLTNICPQNQQLNSGLWNQIEQQCRYWAKKYGELYIVSGPLFLNAEHETIGPNAVVVPEAFFKVVICLEGTPKGIAFICRNTAADRKKDYYVNTISEAERITGYKFFPNLSDELASYIKGQANLKDW